MRVTEVTVFRHPNPQPPYIGSAKIVLDDSLIIRDISIMKKPDGELFIRFPSKQTPSGRQIYLVHPINNEMRMEIYRAISDAYYGADTVEPGSSPEE